MNESCVVGFGFRKNVDYCGALPSIKPQHQQSHEQAHLSHQVSQHWSCYTWLVHWPIRAQYLCHVTDSDQSEPSTETSSTHSMILCISALREKCQEPLQATTWWCRASMSRFILLSCFHHQKIVNFLKIKLSGTWFIKNFTTKLQSSWTCWKTISKSFEQKRFLPNCVTEVWEWNSSIFVSVHLLDGHVHKIPDSPTPFI